MCCGFLFAHVYRLKPQGLYEEFFSFKALSGRDVKAGD